jgi:hypothetical protein
VVRTGVSNPQVGRPAKRGFTAVSRYLCAAGLAADLDLKRILKAFKKNFSCNGALAIDPETEQQVSDHEPLAGMVKGLERV